MLRDKADAKERIGQIQTRGAAWLEPAREVVKRANIAEKLMFSDDLEGIRDFLKIAGSNLRLMPPENYGDWSRLAVAIRTFYDPEYAKKHGE